MDPDLLGAILLVPYTFVPDEYEACDGSTIGVQAHEGLFDLIGTQFGGNGTTEFGLPDLSAVAPLKDLAYIISTNGLPPS